LTTGDVGFCYQLCDSVDQCSIKGPDWVCDHDSTIQSFFNHGACLLEPTDAGSPDAAPDAAADAATEAVTPPADGATE
jgi:hypothetical protein